MAAEDSGDPQPPASDPILPHYPELIMAAIEAVDSKNGANKSTISKQIEASYGNLPAAHKTLLSHHLNKMRASGELVVIKNNYVKPDPNASPRRGRGRPRKFPVSSIPEGAVVGPARPRGRPRKYPVGSNPVPTPSVSSRKRGRPRKSELMVAPVPEPSTGDEQVKTDGDLPPSERSVEKKGRGRPRKVKPAGTPVVMPATGEKRGRGRPPKVKTPVES